MGDMAQTFVTDCLVEVKKSLVYWMDLSMLADRCDREHGESWLTASSRSAEHRIAHRRYLRSL